MTQIDQRARLAREGMYRPEFESDACGVGLVAATDGRASRRVVQSAIDALKAVWHRGAVAAGGKTGHGAGLPLNLPTAFFYDAIPSSGDRQRVVSGNSVSVLLVLSVCRSIKTKTSSSQLLY